jgi:hypothetical protein
MCPVVHDAFAAFALARAGWIRTSAFSKIGLKVTIWHIPHSPFPLPGLFEAHFLSSFQKGDKF